VSELQIGKENYKLCSEEYCIITGVMWTDVVRTAYGDNILRQLKFVEYHALFL
jgi:hypothetical protein